MGHSFMENTQSGQIPGGWGTFIPKYRALTRKLVPLVVPNFLIEKEKIKKTMPLKG